MTRSFNENDTRALTMSRRVRPTPLTERVVASGATQFTVYNRMLLPTVFKSLEEDHAHLCRAVQVWDVGVERQVQLRGPDATRLVQWMTPRDVGAVQSDRCVYLPLADEHGRLMNDPIGLRLDEDHWWLSVADSDVGLWARGLARGAGLDVHVDEPDIWPLAIQGPAAEELMARVFGEEVRAIRFFRHRRLGFNGHPMTVARSGWSRQGGFEVYVDDAKVGQALYDELFARGQDLDVGPGCPNLIERLEGGLFSFGNDMDNRHSPLEAGLGDFCSLDADIDSLSIDALRAERQRAPVRRMRGLRFDAADGAVAGASRFAPDAFAAAGASAGDSFIGSQAWSIRLESQIANAMLDEPLASCDTLSLLLADGSACNARVVDLPFAQC